MGTNPLLMRLWYSRTIDSSAVSKRSFDINSLTLFIQHLYSGTSLQSFLTSAALGYHRIQVPHTMHLVSVHSKEYSTEGPSSSRFMGHLQPVKSRAPRLPGIKNYRKKLQLRISSSLLKRWTTSMVDVTFARRLTPLPLGSKLCVGTAPKHSSEPLSDIKMKARTSLE